LSKLPIPREAIWPDLHEQAGNAVQLCLTQISHLRHVRAIYAAEEAGE
jgi:hypothetical protein